MFLLIQRKHAKIFYTEPTAHEFYLLLAANMLASAISK